MAFGDDEPIDDHALTVSAHFLTDRSRHPLDETIPIIDERAAARILRGDLAGPHGDDRANSDTLICSDVEPHRDRGAVVKQNEVALQK